MVLAGLIYQRGKRLPHVDVAAIVPKLKKVAKALKWVGICVAMTGVTGIVWIWGPLAISNVKYQMTNNKAFAQRANTKSEIQNTKSNWQVPDTNYSIYIPRIGAISRVISDVDANNKKEYLEALKLGVAEAKGLAHPGEKGTTFLFAHSVSSPLDYAMYNAVFYLLDKLESGDEIQIVYKKDLFRYQVVNKEILKATDTKYLVNGNQELLVLQTCWPAGTSRKRLVLTARPVMIY